MDLDSQGLEYSTRAGESGSNGGQAVEKIIQEINQKLETLQTQYETQLEGLRTEIGGRRRSQDDDDDPSTGGADGFREKYQQVTDELGKNLKGDQKEKLDNLVADMDKNYQQQLDNMHQQHVDDVDEQVKAMRSTLEEIYNGQLDLVRSELEQTNQVALAELQEKLDKEHKEEVNKIVQEWQGRLDDLQQDYDREVRDTIHGDSIGNEDSATFIANLNRRLTEEHRQILQKIESELETKSPVRRSTKDSQTDSDTKSLASEPITRTELQQAKDKQTVLSKAQDVKKSLETQCEEIAALRAQMLGEYEQLLTVRAEVMSSQSEEVEKLQQEMALIQQQYEDQMRSFQTKVQEQTETALSATHAKELDEMKQYYETRVSEMEQNYTTDINKLKAEHAELLSRLHEESKSPTKSSPTSSPEKQREYVRKTTTLTVISDEEDELDSASETSPSKLTEKLNTKIKALEDKLKEREKVVDSLKKRLEAEATSAEDLHGRLLDNSKTLIDYEDNLKDKMTELEELKAALLGKDDKISQLEKEKAALEEQGEKGPPKDRSDNEIIEELKEKIKSLENELSASKETNARIKDELNKLDAQHGEAIMQLKEEMEKLNQIKIDELQQSFQIQLEEELKQQSDDLETKFKEERDRYREELVIYKKSESELKDKLSEIQTTHEKQLSELQEKVSAKELTGESGSSTSQSEPKVISFSDTSELDKDSLEAAIRENVRTEILEEYEQSIDKLKSEYEERISDLNTKIQTYESQESEKSQFVDQSKELDSKELEIREMLRKELAQEYKDKLQLVIDDYENRLKQYQVVSDKSDIPVSTPEQSPSKRAVNRSKSLDLESVQSSSRPVSKIPKEYEGYVSGIRKDYEDKISALQTQIAQYRSSSASNVSSTPMSPVSPKEVIIIEKASGDSQDMPTVKSSPDAGSEIPVKLKSQGDQQSEIEQNISELGSQDSSSIKLDHNKQIELMSKEIAALKESSGHVSREELEKQIREEIDAEYKEKIDELTKALELAKAEKTSAEQKVKADMFVWHEEVVAQLKRKHEQTISQLHKEYEEKMDLLREELQEEFDVEKTKLAQKHKQELADVEEKYDNLVEGLRTGEVPEVAQIVQDKYDMELEMAKTLIQQECDETIESEQSRISDEYEKKMKEMLNEKEKELEEQKVYYEKLLADQKVYYEKELVDQRNSLLQQYESQIIELKSKHEAELADIKDEFENRVEAIRAETMEIETRTTRASLSPQKSVSEESEKGEKDEESEKVTSTTGSGKPDKDGDADDDSGAGKGGAESGPTSEPIQKEHENKQGDSVQDEDKDDATDGPQEVQEELIVQQVRAPSLESSVQSFDASEEESDPVKQLRKELEEKIQHYESLISELKAIHEEEIKQLTTELEEKEDEYTKKLKYMEDKHDLEVKDYMETIQKLREGETDEDGSEAMEMAHQEEMKGLENRLVLKHKHEIANLEKQHQSKMDDMAEKHKTVVEDLQKQLNEAQRALDQYHDVQSPVQTVPTFHGDSTLGSTKESVEDFMVPSKSSASEQTASQVQTPRSEQGSDMGTMETQVFEAKDATEDATPPGSPDRTLEDIGVQSLETSMDRSRGSLRGVDDTQDTDMIEFSEEESDKSIEEAGVTGKTDRSTPSALMQTLHLGADVPGGPTVKSLDDTTDSSLRVSDREDLVGRIKELETEVEDLRRKLDYELTKQEDHHDRLDREQQEEGNLVSMLRADIDRLNGDRESYQSTNEHLLGLLSDTVKTYMGVEERISKRLKTLMEKPAAEKPADKPSQATDERKKTPTPQKLSPIPSPGRISPARPEDPENPQETSILSNITDEGLDLSQRISDSIFQGPELAAEEEELLTDAGHRLQTSVGRLLDMIVESTSQLLDTKQTQSELMEQLDMKGTGLEQMTARCNDLEERLKEESERKDFLALELHKAEGLIEGYTSERELQEEKARDLEEQKETLVLELETTKSKLQDLVETHSEAQELKRRLAEQEEMLKRNVGEEAQASNDGASDEVPPSGKPALMLEVSRLSSENREKDSKIQQVHDKYESRVRELENSGEDMEHHYSKLLDERKQDMADMKLQVDALEKQLKSKKQFIEEQSAEREQEHEDYQKELGKWKQMVQDLEKHHGSETNLHKEVEELSEQLMTRIDQHNEALLESEKWQRTVKEQETQIQDLKAVIQSTEQELQEKTDEIEQLKQVTKLEEELSRRPVPDDDLTDSVKSDGSAPKTKDSSDLEQTMEHYRERLMTQMTVEEELRQAAHRTKEELVREKHALQTQVNENLVQISALRNKLDEMRHRRDLSDPSDLAKRLDVEREKAEEKDQQISDLKLEVERLSDTIERKENELAQLKDRTKRSSPTESLEYESDKEIERQMENLKRENRKLKDKLRLAEAGTVTDMSGLSQELIDEKNQEIDQLSEQVFRLQTEFNELKAEKGVEGVYEELDSLKEELRLKETELTGLQSVQVSQTFTDHSLTPDSSIMNVRASFADKTSIQQEMEEFEANRQEKMASLESEVTTLQTALEDKQAQVTSLQNKVDELSEQVKHQDTEDENILQEILHEKEEMVTQLTVQIEGLQSEVDNLTEFQTKLQEDFDTVQTMLEEKEREIESLNKELESTSVDREQHSLVIKHEVEIARLKKDLREKDNVVEEKLEELAEMVDKVELLESQISKYKSQEADYDKQIVAKDRQIVQLRKEIDSPLSAEEKDKIIKQKTEETEMLKKEIQSLTSARPSFSPGSSISLSGRPSTSLSEEEKSQLIDEQAMEIKSLKDNIEELLGRPPSPTTEEEKSVLIKKQRDEIVHLKQQVDLASEGKSPSSTLSEEIKSDVIQRLKREIERLKQQIMDSNLSEDDKSALIRQLRLENETLKRQVDAALKIKPPSPPMDEDEKSEMIHKQKEEISSLKNQLEASLTIRPPSPPRTDDEKSVLIEEQKEEILNLRKQVQAALQVTPPPAPMSDDEKDQTIELRQAEVAELRSELNKVTQALHSGEDGQFMKDKIEEVVTLKTELNLVKQKLESPSLSSIESMKSTIKEKDKKLIQAEEKVKQLEEDLESLKEVKAYEDEIQLQEKDDEIEELKSELEGYRSRAESSTIAQSIDIELPSSDTGTPESKELVRSMSFYKDQYEEKCSENRKLQVDLDLVKQQLERARSDKLEDAQEEIELFKAELERKNDKQVGSLKEKKEILEKENIELKQQLSMTADERIISLESQVEAAKAEASKERIDSVQAIKDLEQIRDRKEKERKTSLQTIHSLEEDIESKAEVEKELRNQVKTLTEELTVIKRQYGIEGDYSKDSSRPLSKLSSFRSESTDSFEIGTDVQTLQEQVMQFKKQADKAKETLAEKQKYQSQVVKLEIQYENLQKQMKREVGHMEEQLKSFRTSSEQDVWAQLQATQDRLEKTTDQLAETGHRLSDAESKLQEVSKELLNRESDMKHLQQDLWKTSGQLSVTSGKLQETEEKLRLTVAQVTEREDQIHQLQGELQHTQQEVEKAEQKSRPVVDRKEEVKYLEERLKKTEAELEEVQKSLKESVQMSEQQLQMVETKDEEYVKLKLDIQQTIASKDKLIRDQKQKIKDAEEEVQEVRQKMEEMERSKENEILRMKGDSTKLQEQSSKLHKQIDELNEELNRPGREAERESPTLVALRTQLQNQEEVILTLGSDLEEAKSTIKDREKEIEEIQARNVQMRRDETETVEAMHNQIAQLQQELAELHSVRKSNDRVEGGQNREESPFDQNGRTPSSDRQIIGQANSPDLHDQTDRRLHDSPSFDDSGHQSYDHTSRQELQAKPDRHSPPISHLQDRRSPSSDHPDDGNDDNYPQGQGQRVASSGSRQSNQHHGKSPDTELPQDVRYSQSGSPVSERRPFDEQFTQEYRSQNQRSQQGSPLQSSAHLSQQGSPIQRSQQGSPVQKSPQRSPTHSASIGSRQSPTDEQNIQYSAQRRDQEFAKQSAEEIWTEEQRYSPTRDDGETFDRDGNLRPRYSRSVEGHPSARVESAESSRMARSQEALSQTSSPRGPHVGSHRPQSDRGQPRKSGQQIPIDHQGEGHLRMSGEGSMPEGLSPDTERYIQQMRRELLITKTALMQIQRGDRLDREMTAGETELINNVLSDVHRPPHNRSQRQHDSILSQDRYYSSLPDDQEINRLRREIEKLEEELELFRSTSNLSARDFVQKVMNLKDELSIEHQRHVEELTTRAQQDTESQLAALRIKSNDEIEHLKSNHARELENKLQDLRQNLERKHKKDTNKLIVKHQEEVSLLKARGSDTGSVGRGDGVGQDRSTMVNGHREPIPGRLQGILQRLHTEGVQVLTISELETLRRSQTQSVLPQSADIESLQTGWENERQSYLSTIQSLKDLLSQTHKLQGLEKDDDGDDDDYFLGAEGSDWRAELLRAIAYVFTKERESLLAELRSHVLSHPNTSFDEIQRLEHKIRTMESHHQDSMDQIFNADRQSMLAEIRDLHAHATIARMHNHEERTKATERLQDTEDQAMKKERQLKRQDSDDQSSSEYEVQLLEFKIQQEKILQDDLRTSLDAEQTRSTELSTQLNEEKTGTYDLQTTVSALQMQCGKLKESLEREQSRYVSVTNALEEEKSKSLNLSELLESERQTLWRVQSELEAVRQQQSDVDMALVEQLQGELEQEREKRTQAESFMEMDRVALDNLRQEVEMEKRRQVAIETELSAKITNMHKIIDAEKQRGTELDIALERERNLSHHLRQKLEAEKSNSEELTGRERALIDDLNTQLENQRIEIEGLNRALQQEQRTRENVSSSEDSEKRLLKDHLDQERSMNNDLKREVDQLQFDRLEAVNKLQKEREAVQRLKMEQDRVNEEIRKLRNLELQRDQDRDSERHSDRDKVRQADREKEDFKMKLHEQELETQRLSQKVARLEEELSDSREKELRAIRDLEHERVRRSSPASEMISVQTSPRLDPHDLTSAESMAEQRERWHVYRSQLESMCQSLHYLVLRCRDQLGKATHGGPRHGDVSDFDVLQTSLRDLLSEVKQLQEMESDFMSHPSSSVNERILRQNEELTGFVARMGEEKTELRNALTQLEEEIWQYRQMDAKYQDMQRNSEHADHIIVAERAEWAKEKLSLQMALNAAEREIDLLQTDLRVERERRVAAGMTETTESDKIKIQRLYGKYLRAESFRKGLVYQKKYLLVLLGGFQDTEETTLALLSRMGAVDQYSLRRIKPKPLTMFRGAVRVVIAISRMRYLVKKWRRATRVGSEVVGGAVDQTNGYMPQSSSYSPPRHGTSPRYSSAPIRSSSSPPHATTYRHQSPLRSSDPSSTYGSQSSHFEVDPYSAYAYQPRLGTSRMPSTPPKKDYSSTTKYTSPSSGARRKILTSASIPAPTSRVRFSSDTSNNGTLGDPDEYINRLENLQSRLGSLQSGRKRAVRQPWR